LYDGCIGQLSSKETWGAWVPVDDLYNAYKSWMDEQHRTRLLDKKELGTRLGMSYWSDQKSQNRREHSQRRCWLLRSLADARRAFDYEQGTQEDWGDGVPQDVNLAF
jgi:hypothetical protein